jgi:type II secretion system protein H
MNRKAHSGYSLIEVLVVLTIIGLLTGLAAASFAAQLPHLRLNHAARALVSDLRWARQLAIASGQPVQIVLDLERERYRIERRSQPGVPIGPVRDLQDRRQGFGEIDLVGSTGGVTLIFYPYGTTNTWTTVTLRNQSGEQRQITLVATGRAVIK